MPACDNDLLPAWLQHAMNASQPVRVDFTGARHVTVCPQQQRYQSNIVDGSVATEDHAAAGFALLHEQFPGAHAQPIRHLHWTLLVHRLQQQQRQGIDFEFHVMRLVSWPSLTHLPDDLVPLVARICALLARKPTTSSLIPLTLDLTARQVFPILEALRLKRHIVALHASLTAEQAIQAASASSASAQAMAGIGQPAAHSLTPKLWQRLLPQRGQSR